MPIPMGGALPGGGPAARGRVVRVEQCRGAAGGDECTDVTANVTAPRRPHAAGLEKRLVLELSGFSESNKSQYVLHPAKFSGGSYKV